ncbi:MAG: hypothetical protein ABH846_03540 [Patescibacteria group bacterium]
MKYVFVRVAEGVELTTSWHLLSGDDAELFTKDREAWLKRYNPDGGYVVSHREFSTHNLDNATGSSDPVSSVFTALLALDSIDRPMVSDLFATIFAMGNNTSKDLTGEDSAYNRAVRRRIMFEGP